MSLVSLSCFPGPCGSKKGKIWQEPAALPFPRVFLTQPSIVFKEQPILFARTLAHYGSLIFAAFFYYVDKEWSVHIHPFCMQGSYSKQERNQKSGQNIPPYNMSSGARAGWWTKPYIPFCMEFFEWHPFILQAFCKSLRFIAIRRGPWPLKMNFKGDGQVKISPYKMVRFCSGAALPLPCVFLTQPTIVYKEQPILFVRK